jgi:hypothetical protein
MSTTPHFKLSIKGILPGFEIEQVQDQLRHEQNLAPEQVQELLSNAAPLSQALLEHRKAFRVQTRLREMGVDCMIYPVTDNGQELVARPSLLHPSVAEARSSLWPPLPRSRGGLVAGLVLLIVVLMVSFLAQSNDADSAVQLTPKVVSMSHSPVVQQR